MGKTRSRAQRPLRPTLRPRTATRSRFVSSGLGLSKPKANQNANTTRIPYRYTEQEKWNTFVSNGRPKFHKSCLLLCDVIFEGGDWRFWAESHSHLLGEHADVKALRHIITKEQQADTVARSVAMYMSFSPCADCADFIIDFSTSRPQCQLSVRFSCLFRHKEDRHRDGLRRLNAARRVVVGVFTNREWMRVAEATGISFRQHVPKRQAGDLKWKAKFENILKEQPGTSALRPSVPSQHHRSTARATTSSVLSLGRVSRMWWQSRDEQRENLLDDVMVETPEDDVAVTRSVTNRSVCYGILIVAIVVIGALMLNFSFR